jgi:RNA polymerase sigma-70 factor, ECF subfamily
MTVPQQFDGEESSRFELMVERYAALLRMLIQRHCPRDLGIQVGDIEQEARVRLWRALEREKEIHDPASYIHRIAVTTTIDAVRRVIARREDQLRLAETAEDEETVAQVHTLAADETQSPESVAQRRELMNAIGATVAALPENRRRAVELHLQGLTLPEIAELLGWTEGKARNLVYRGLDDLRSALRSKGIEWK